MLETDCVIDDFGKKCIDIFYLLTWFDRYPCSVESKGGMLPLHVVNFVVTSNFHPKDLFMDDDGSPHPQIPALLRRMRVTHMLNYFNTE